MSRNTQEKTIQRVLIANRGEIAVRIIRTLRDMGKESVAIFSDSDDGSSHRFLADYAIRLSGNTSAETYLNIRSILEAAQRSGADAIHPGYGFLSENATFAEEVTKAGFKFIGPPAEAMKKMGDKISAKEIMNAANIPTLPGSDGALQSIDEVKQTAERVGYPLILKAAAGGGGRGMRVVNKDEDLQSALESCQREAQSYFGNPEVFCEKYIETPRHIEFQIMMDSHGNGVHLFERDCSIQRRHQKLFEEAPSMYLSPEQRERLGKIAVDAAKAVGYEGAGTVEFICESPDKAYFMEMNTRLQVEHPVTEAITGTDLVAAQILVAEGRVLPWQQEELEIKGWAMEARINAENPSQGFRPDPGTIAHFVPCLGPHVRIDTHVYSGYKIPEFFDSMIAKVISWGETREKATARMKRALSELRLQGIDTTISFHEALLSSEDFIGGKFSTKFIAEHESALTKIADLPAEDFETAALIGATLEVRKGRAEVRHCDRLQTWRETARREATHRSL